MIEGFQPYKRGTVGFSSPLCLLQEINNADKHRLLQSIIGQVVGTSLGIRAMSGVYIRTGRMFKGRPLINNTKLGGFQLTKRKAEGYVNVDFKATVEIQFWEGCDAVKKRPVIQTLSSIISYVIQIEKTFPFD